MADQPKITSKRSVSGSDSSVLTLTDTLSDDKVKANDSDKEVYSFRIDTGKVEEENKGEEIYPKAYCVIVEENLLNDQSPQIIYKSPSKSRQRIPKKAKYLKHVIRVKPSIKKNNHRRMDKKLERIIDKKPETLCKITNQINSTSISDIDSLCRILREVPAKESLIDDIQSAEENILENNEEITPSLNQEDSFISNNNTNDLTSKTDNKSSVINVIDDDSVIFFVDEQITKKNIVNVSRAQVDNITFGNRKSTPSPSSGKLFDEQNLINDTDSLVNQNMFTSDPESMETLGGSSEQGGFFTSSEGSVETLINDDMKSQPFVDDNSYVLSLNSNQSNITLQMQKLDIISTESCTKPSTGNFTKPSISYTQQAIMNTVIDLGMFPEMTSSASSSNLNDVIVAGRLQTNFNPKMTKEKNTAKNDQNNDINDNPNKNVVQKSLNPATDKGIKPKPVMKLLNQDTINDLLRLSEKYKPEVVQEEWRGDYPSSIAELWEKLENVLDSKIQKLEKTLTDKILSEINISLRILDKFKKLADKEEIVKNTKSYIEKDTYTRPDGLDIDLQCDLIENEERWKPHDIATETVSSMFFKDKNEVQNNIKPSFEILKPAMQAAGDSQDIISIVVDKPSPQLATHTNYRARPKLSIVKCFLKENAVVLAGVPFFIFILLLVYFAIILIVKFL